MAAAAIAPDAATTSARRKLNRPAARVHQDRVAVAELGPPLDGQTSAGAAGERAPQMGCAEGQSCRNLGDGLPSRLHDAMIVAVGL